MKTLLLCAACAAVSLTACMVETDLAPASGPEGPVDPAADPADAAAGHAGVERHIALNHIALNHIALNGLIANFEANRELTLVPLRSESFTPGAAYPLLRSTLLADAWARDFMGYLVSCALGESQSVTLQDASGGSTTWTGSLGLCTGWGAVNGAAGVDCQELVSSCILARVNKLGEYVPLSPRGDGLGASTLAASIQSVPQDQKTGALISALGPCWAGAHGFDDCGWRLESVVTCRLGDVVKIGAGGRKDGTCDPAVGWSGNDTVLRVTEGVRARNLGPAPAGIRPYQQWQDDDTSGSCGNLSPYVEFTCNFNGVYSVMTAPYWRTTGVAQTNLAAPAAVGGVLGNNEQGVFRQKEGGFYGNIFTPSQLGVQVYLDQATNLWRVFEFQTQQDRPRNEQLAVRATIFKDMWVCSAPEWTTPAALFHSRLCALPTSGEGCAATWVGVCGTGPASTPMCSSDDTALVAGHGGWDECRDGLGGVRHNIVSTFLAGQCDAVPDSSLCGTVNNPLALP
jgi:hypothetical protein